MLVSCRAQQLRAVIQQLRHLRHTLGYRDCGCACAVATAADSATGTSTTAIATTIATLIATAVAAAAATAAATRDTWWQVFGWRDDDPPDDGRQLSTE